MALIIPSLKLGNKTTENAYAKVSRVSVDDNSTDYNNIYGDYIGTL